MSILDEKLETVAKLLENHSTDNENRFRKNLYKKIKDNIAASYEWARVIMLIGGRKLQTDEKEVRLSTIYDTYGMSLLYNDGAFRKAIGTALTGKTGQESPSCKDEEAKEQLKKFDDGRYDWNWTLKDFMEYIYNNDTRAKKSQQYLKEIMDILGSDDENTEEVKKMEGKMNRIIADAIENNKQVILTGAPGTGKTFSVRKYVDEKTKEKGGKSRFVQFHSSYDYTDFVEGLRPVPDQNGGNAFVRMDGIFKDFCREVVRDNLDRLRECIIPEVSDQNGQAIRINDIEDYYKYMINAEEETRTTIYEKLDEVPCYFMIDEINRADLSKVFGELMFGLEESYREINNRFDTQYKNLPTYHMNTSGIAEPLEEDCFRKGFFVPYNVHIIGTMNDIDRSVESFDFALRRRFIWIDMKANEVMKEALLSMREDSKEKTIPSDDVIETITKRIQNMNEKISEFNGLSEAYHIGPAYFKEIVKVNNDAEVMSKLEGIFHKKIEPIIREYTRGRKTDAVQELVDNCRKALIEGL